jgi:uncharacterized protein
MKVEHDDKRSRFLVRLGSYEACLMYARREGVLDFYHIYVPDPYRNRGIAGRILIAAFDYAAAQGLKVVPSCPFIAGDFLPRFPRYQDLVERGAFPFVDGNL